MNFPVDHFSRSNVYYKRRNAKELFRGVGCIFIPTDLNLITETWLGDIVCCIHQGDHQNHVLYSSSDSLVMPCLERCITQ